MQNNRLEEIIDRLTHQRYAIVDNVLPEDVIDSLRNEIIQADHAHELHHAKIGQNAQQLTTIRSDLICWIDETTASSALQVYLDFLEQLRSAVNYVLQLGLFEHEIHYTLYRKGSFYHQHVDQFAKNKSRQLSFILYLNEDWQEQYGGALSLFDADENLLVKLLPEANRFICFFSDLPHEISITTRERFSVTGWFKRRG